MTADEFARGIAEVARQLNEAGLMTTNDPLNPYPGNLKRHEVKVEQKRKLIDMMHDDAKDGLYEQPKRELHLNDGSIYFDASGQPTNEMAIAYSRGAIDVSDFYERLIDDGRLRVVEEVGIDEDGNCTKCGWDSDHRYPFSTCCPGCGNPIKR